MNWGILAFLGIHYDFFMRLVLIRRTNCWKENLPSRKREKGRSLLIFEIKITFSCNILGIVVKTILQPQASKYVATNSKDQLVWPFSAWLYPLFNGDNLCFWATSVQMQRFNHWDCLISDLLLHSYFFPTVTMLFLKP